MNKLIILLLLYTPFTFADWIATGSDIYSATETQGIQNILQLFPEISNTHPYNADEIRELTVSNIEFTYEGETTCVQDDPRLSYEHFSYFLCLKNNPNTCFDHFDELKPDTDPCLENN